MILYQALIVVLLVLLLANTVANVWTMRRLRSVSPPVEGPSVSVLIGAREDENAIEDAVRSLLYQDYPNYELLILDDDSSDRTAEIAEAVIRETGNPGIYTRVIRGEDLPEGWTEKNWACHQLAEAASGDYLFFTNGHTIHEPGTISALVDEASRKRASLLSGWPRLLSGNVMAEMVSAIVPFVVLTIFPIWLQRLTQYRQKSQDRGVNRIATIANGDYLFFTRDCYERIGGHAAVRGQRCGGVALAQAVTLRADTGLRYFHCDAARFSKSVWTGSFSEVREHCTKFTSAIFDQRKPAFWITAAALLVVYLLPFVNVWLVATQNVHTVVQQIVLIYLIQMLMVFRMGTSFRGALLHPVGFALTVWIATTSRVRERTASVEQKEIAQSTVSDIDGELASEETPGGSAEEEREAEERPSFKHLLP